MEIWKKKIIVFMSENDLSRIEFINMINRNGGNINQSGLTHWLNEERESKRRTSKPSPKNAIALKNIIGGDFDFETIYNGKKNND